MQFETMSPAQIHARLAFIGDLDLGGFTGSVAQAAAPGRGRSLGAPANTPDASVVDASIISFVSGMSEQNKEDVRNSYLYASLVATKKFPSQQDGDKWYELFVEVMSKVGWVFVDRRYDRSESSNLGLSMDQAGLQIIASVAASAALPATIGTNLLKACTGALESLKKSENLKPLSVLQSKANDNDGARFSLGACAEDEDNEVIMAFGSVQYLSPDRKGNFLFISWDRTATSMYSAKARMALNPTVYAMARPMILKALGKNIETAIAHYEI